jgi:hypothetical protein
MHFPVGQVSEMIHELNPAAADAAPAEKLLCRQTALRFDQVFADTPCVKADIHFPVDWVLLRDAACTLVQALSGVVPNPDFDLLPRFNIQFTEPVSPGRFKALCPSRLFFDMNGTQLLERPCEFSHPVVDR